MFNKIGSKSFRSYMCRIRKQPHTKKPPFMNLDIWLALCKKWEAPEFSEKSDRGKVARHANKRLHIGGSISSAEHKSRLQKQLGRELTAAELFERTHKRKDNTFVDNEAQDTWERYNEKYSVDDSIDTQSGNVSGTYPRWVDHVGLKNGRVYGLGSGVDEFALHHNNDEPSVRTSDNTELYLIREMVQRQQEEQEILKATQLAQAQRLDEMMQSQALLEEKLRRTLTEEMQRATQKLLEVLQYRLTRL